MVQSLAGAVEKNWSRDIHEDATELAAEAIEKIIDPSAPPEERAQRRRRLTKGPAEFSEDRVDQPKSKR